jgi:delta 1-pyrroline-5-carboxylate dehydrogenase
MDPSCSRPTDRLPTSLPCREAAPGATPGRAAPATRGRTGLALLDDGAWQGKVWTGAWTDGSGGTYDVVEPATGGVVGAVGRATPEDVVAAADRAAEAQRAWAAAPFEDRARVLRRAGEVL